MAWSITPQQATLIAAVMGVVVSFLNRRRLDRYHHSVNGRIDELVASAKAAGIVEGIAKEKQRAKDDEAT